LPTQSVLAAALAAACATGAQAQSTVQLFGVIDTGVVRLSEPNRHRTLLQADGNTSSRLGFRGTEDLGGGLTASFWLEAAVATDSGVGGASNTNNQTSGVAAAGAGTFGRRSTVGLGGAWGEVRLGRDYVPTFSNLTTSMHPFGTNGVGSAGSLFYPVAAGGTTARTNVRASNSIGYFLPGNLGGFYGNAMIAMGENASNAGATESDGDYKGVRLGWRGAGFNTAFATGKTDYATGDYTQTNFGANYQWGPAQIMYLWGRNKVGVTRTTAQMIGVQYRLGPGELRAAYTHLKAVGVANDATHIAIGYVYEMSKRTALYANYGTIDNKGTGTAFDVGLAVTRPGGTSRGIEAGIRHSF
jgi:predicted porin